MIVEIERWLPVRGYEDHYEVSTFGRLRSVGRLIANAAGATRVYGGEIIKGRPGDAGHLYASLSRDNHVKTVSIHVLICEAFHGPKPADKDLVAHWDGNPANNRPENLRWATYAENEEDKRRHERHAWGRRNPGAKLTPEEVDRIKAKRHWVHGEKAEWADALGISRTMLSDIVNGKAWNPEGNVERRARRAAGPLPPPWERASVATFGRPIPELRQWGLTGGEIELLGVFIRHPLVSRNTAHMELFGHDPGGRTRSAYYVRLGKLKPKLLAAGYRLHTTKAGGAWLEPADREALTFLIQGCAVTERAA